MDKNKQIMDTWKFDEQIHSELWNDGIYKTITFETDEVDKETYDGMRYLARKEELRHIIHNANPNFSHSIAGGIDCTTYIANVILNAGYCKASEVAADILMEFLCTSNMDEVVDAYNRVLKRYGLYDKFFNSQTDTFEITDLNGNVLFVRSETNSYKGKLLLFFFLVVLVIGVLAICVFYFKQRNNNKHLY